MITGEIHILPTDNAPEFNFSSEGMIKIRGRGLFQNNRPVILMIPFGSRMTSGVLFVGNIIFWFFDKILSFIENCLPT
ncbi:MAG TPA: hypothetical protein VIK14_01230 [Ignavibacteria bacterium]